MIKEMDPHVGIVHARDYRTPEMAPLGRNELDIFPAADQNYRDLRLRASKLCDLYNLPAIHVDIPDDRTEILKKLLHLPTELSDTCSVPRIKSPFYVDYGIKLKIHPSVFINRNCMILDNPIWPVSVDKNTLVGPNVVISSVSHPSDWRVRNGQLGPSLAGSVKIGKDCFIGANVTILPGVSIGDGCVIGACSVVTRSVPDYHVALGSPAKTVRKIDRCIPNAVGLEYAADGISVLLEPTMRSEMKDSMCRSPVEGIQDRSIVAILSASLVTIFATLLAIVWLCAVR